MQKKRIESHRCHLYRCTLYRLSFLIAVLGLTTSGPAAVKAGGSAADLITLKMDSYCPSGTNLNGDAFPFSCYGLKSNNYAAGSRHNQTLQVGGDWKIRCSDGAVRDIGYFHVDFPIRFGTHQWVVTRVPNPCGGAATHITISAVQGTAGYGDGTNFGNEIYTSGF